MADLFDGYGYVESKKPDKTCKTCAHRQRWHCGGSIIQYCGMRKSKRTFNGLLKIKVINPACELYEEAKRLGI